MNENEFGYRIRQALDEGLARLDYRTTYRLQQARDTALGASAYRRAGPGLGPRPADGRRSAGRRRTHQLARAGWGSRRPCSRS